jgi:predicted transcriptional regulator
MKNPELGKHLREYRKKNNYSVDYVIECLKKDYNISYSSKSLYSWEVGQNQPPADILLILCKIYKISNILTGNLMSDFVLMLLKDSVKRNT